LAPAEFSRRLGLVFGLRQPRTEKKKQASLFGLYPSAMAPVLATMTVALSATAAALQTSHSAGGTRNVCMKGHFAPEFFLLGVPRSGTTRFFDDFVKSPGVVTYAPEDGEPSWHTREPWVFDGGFDQSYTDHWLSHYPECSRDGRFVATDCTPGYFGNREAPYALAKLYEWFQVKRKLVFMVFLMNPVARMHSHYYHYVENGALKGALADCPLTKFPATFYATVRNLLDRGNVCDCPCDNIVSDSKYAVSFRRYFDNFRIKQFHIVPYNKVVEKAVVEYTWDILGVPHGLPSLLAGSSRIAGDVPQHPDIVSELDEDTLLQLEGYMEEVSGASTLAALFAGTDVNLFNYTGQKDDGLSIERWLRGAWGL